jgi:glucose-6-phosphate 1-epimerase
MPVQVSDTKVEITHQGSTCTIYLIGATVTSWVVGGKEKLFVSKQALYDGSKPIRGGIPLVFPHFGTVEGSPMPQHGFARNSLYGFIAIHLVFVRFS